MTLNLKCANAECGMEFRNSKSVNLTHEQSRIGDLHVCGGCMRVSEVCLLEPGTRLLSPEEYEQLDEQTKRDLSFALKALIDKARRNDS